MIYIADTHPVVWFLEGNPRLSAKAKAILSDPSARLVIPTIVLAEIRFLYNRRRIGIDVQAVLRNIASATNCIVYPLDQTVVEFLPTSLEIHDAIIVATALVFRDILGEQVAIVYEGSRNCKFRDCANYLVNRYVPIWGV